MSTIRHNEITEKTFAMQVERFEVRFSEWYNCYIIPTASGKPLPLKGAVILLADLSHDLTEFLNGLSGKPFQAFEERKDGTFTASDLPANIRILESITDACNGLLILLHEAMATENPAKDAAISIAEMLSRDFRNFALAL